MLPPHKDGPNNRSSYETRHRNPDQQRRKPGKGCPVTPEISWVRPPTPSSSNSPRPLPLSGGGGIVFASWKITFLFMRFLLRFSFLLFFLACEDTFQYSPNEVSPFEEDIHARNIERIQNSSGSDVRFLVISDIHQAYEELATFVDRVNEMSDIRFVVVTGDLTNFGVQFEYDEVHRELSRLDIPYLAVIGNHDMLGNGQKVYEAMYGPQNFWFAVGSTRFVFLNTNSREANFSATVPDLDFLRQSLSDTASFSDAFVVGHVPPMDADFNPALVEGFEAAMETGKVRACLTGHQHNYSLTDPYENNILHLVSDDLQDRSYAKVTLSGKDFSIEKINF